ncbi:MAG TPA: hypothetical protein DDY25_09750 [Peptococcaceae bacterium]|nr:hypothetical protein [Peptococcaceae bacterium]
MIFKRFLRKGGCSAWFCTLGIIMVVKALLARNPSPSDDEFRDARRVHLFRCTGYDSK